MVLIRRFALFNTETVGYPSFSSCTHGSEYLKVMGVFEQIKVRLQIDGFLKVAQELPLEGHDLLDVAKQGVDFGARKKRLLFERLQVVFQEAVQMLEPTKRPWT